MPLIIDTYNVLHVEGVLPAHLAGLDVDGLARLVERSRHGAEAVWLVCDGSSQRARRLGRVVVEPAGPGRSADDHIADWLAAHSAPRRVTVVTSDRAVARRARARGASCVSSEEFLAMLVADEPKAAARARARTAAQSDPRRLVPLSEREVAGWMRLFGISAELAAVEAAGGGQPAGGDADDRTRSAPSGDRADGPPAPRSATAGRRGRASPPTGSRTPVLDEDAIARFLSDFGPGEDARRTERGRERDPLAALDGRDDHGLLAALGALDGAELDRLMREHEPSAMMAAKARPGAKSGPTPGKKTGKKPGKHRPDGRGSSGATRTKSA